MKKKKCITLVSQLAIFLLVTASTVFNPYGVGKVEAALLCDASVCSTKQAEHLVYGNSNVLQMQSGSNTSDDGSKVVQGDVNIDGSVNSIDFAHMRMYLLGMPNSILSKEKISIADLNMDREFNSIDLGIMRGYLLGKISGFPGDAPATPAPSATPTPKPSATAIPSPVSTSDDFTSSISKASYSVQVGEEVKGRINYEGDKDYMIFRPSVDGKYRLDVTTNPDSTRGYLYTLKIEGLDCYYSSFKTYSTNNGCYVQEDLLSNTEYYIGIKNVNGSTALDSYTIKITKLD